MHFEFPKRAINKGRILKPRETRKEKVKETKVD